MIINSYHAILQGPLTVTVHDKFVHASRTQRGRNGLGHYLACVDVADDLGLSLRSVGPLLQKDDLRGLFGGQTD